MITEAQIRRIALALPGAYEQRSYEGRPSWRTKPRMFAWIRPKPEALVVWVDSLEAKKAMLICEPERFFTTPHYDGYPTVLVRLDAIDGRRAKELITESWRLRAPASLVRSGEAKRDKARRTTGKKRKSTGRREPPGGAGRG